VADEVYSFSTEPVAPEEMVKIARTLLEQNYVVLPIKKGDKRPIVKEWQKLTVEDVKARWSEFEKLFRDGAQLGIKGDNLLFLDFEDYHTFVEFLEFVKERNPIYKTSLNNTWVEFTGVRCPKCQLRSKHDITKEGDKWKCALCGLVFDASEKNARGVRVIFRVRTPFRKAKAYGRYGEALEVKGEGSQTLVSPSIHPSGVRYQAVQYWGSAIELSEEEQAALLSDLEIREREVFRGSVVIPQKERKLDANTIHTIYSLIKEGYRQGHRNDLELAISGWLRRAGVSYEDAKKLFELLTEGAEEEHKKQAFQRLERTYTLEDVSALPSLKSERGVLEVLKESLGDEEKALAIVSQLQDIIGFGSPFMKDAVFEELGGDRYAVSLPSKRSIVRGRFEKEQGKFRITDIVLACCPKEVVIYSTPFSSVRTYEVTFESAEDGQVFKLGPATLEEILGRLQAEGFVKNSFLAKDTFTAVMIGWVRKGRALIKREADRAGFFLEQFNGSEAVTPVGIDCEPPFIDELREALETLNIIMNYSKHFGAKASEIVRRVIVAPFNFIYKQKGVYIPWFWLYGFTGSGKTTFSLTVLHIWGTPSIDGNQHATVPRVTSGSSTNTEARLGAWLAGSGTPLLINEAYKLLERKEVLEMIKNAVESTQARGRFMNGMWETVPSLPFVIFSSNQLKPDDAALLRKLTFMNFNKNEFMKSNSQKHEFMNFVKQNANKLSAIGKMVGFFVSTGLYKLSNDWLTDSINLLKMLYQEVGMQTPEWVFEQYTQEEASVFERLEEMKEQVRVIFVDAINQAFLRAFKEYEISGEEEDIKTKVKKVVEANLVPYLLPYKGKGKRELCGVIITTAVLEEIKRRNLNGADFGAFSNLAEVLGDGFEYITLRMRDKGMRCIKADMDAFLRFLNPNFEEPPQSVPPSRGEEGLPQGSEEHRSGEVEWET